MSKIYGKPNFIAKGAIASLGTTETDLFVITEQDKLTQSQLNAFISFALGTHSSIEFRYYGRSTPGGTWFELPYRNVGTGAIASVPTIANASTPLNFIDDRPMPACAEFKMTAKGIAGANGVIAVALMARDN